MRNYYLSETKIGIKNYSLIYHHNLIDLKSDEKTKTLLH